jgi:predicted nucleic acid-binding protein
VRATAAAYDDPGIRSLDAIHLATADAVLADDLTAFVTYDRRLLAAAEALSLPTASPGA